MYKKSIGYRLLAYIIDYLMIFILGGILYALVGFGTFTSSAGSFNFSLNWYEIIITSLIYFISFAIFNQGKTIGKLVTGVEIRDSNLHSVENKTLIIRELIKSVLAVISLISFIVVLVRSDRKSLHDLVVDTVVIRKVNQSEFIDEVEVSIDDNEE